MLLAQLSELLPLPESELQQVLDYAAGLSKAEAATHFGELLGDSPRAVDFISTFNSRRKEPSLPQTARGSGGKQGGRRGGSSTASRQHERASNGRGGPSGSGNSSRAVTPPQTPPQPQPQPQPSAGASRQPARAHASAAGYFLTGDRPSAKGKSKSTPSSRSSTPKPPQTKVSITGGTPMAGQSTALSDLDAAIQALEITTNPGLDKGKRRKCNCVAARHPLQSAAPNCLSCGKVVCVKEGLGPCTFCGTRLVNADDAQAMLRELKDERGRKRMTANASANRKAAVSKTPPAFSQNRGGNSSEAGPSLAEAAAMARQHRDKLLDFQAQNAQRTTVRDEAADFDVSGAMSGTGNMWASPEERARELKRQQKLMREMEWNAQPDYEKRRQVISIDVSGGKVVRKMAPIARPTTPDSEDDDVGARAPRETIGSEGGAFSRNPLLGALMRPVMEATDDTGQGERKNGKHRARGQERRAWRRVQDDDGGDNETTILNGGAYGHG